MRLFFGLGVSFVLLLASSRLMAAGTEGAAFLDIPVGAGPAALGSAYSALAADAYAPVYNPGGLGFLDSNEVAAQHLEYLESIHYEYLSFVHPLGTKGEGQNSLGALGGSIQYLGSGDITGIDRNQVPTGNYSSYYSAYSLSYGKPLGEHLSLGLTGKLIHAKIDDVSASAYAADLGAMDKINDHLTMAATLTNLGTKLKFLSDGDSLPLAFRVGGAYRFDRQWLATSDVVYRQAGPASWHGGGEWHPVEPFSLRLGYRTDTLTGLSPLAGLTVGFGVQMWGSELAYAWLPLGDLGSSHYLSFLLRFGEQEKKRRNLIYLSPIKKNRSVKSGGSSGEKSEPDQQQLMQLLNNDKDHMAASPKGNSR